MTVPSSPTKGALLPSVPRRSSPARSPALLVMAPSRASASDAAPPSAQRTAPAITDASMVLRCSRKLRASSWSPALDQPAELLAESSVYVTLRAAEEEPAVHHRGDRQNAQGEQEPHHHWLPRSASFNRILTISTTVFPSLSGQNGYETMNSPVESPSRRTTWPAAPLEGLDQVPAGAGSPDGLVHGEREGHPRLVTRGEQVRVDLERGPGRGQRREDEVLLTPAVRDAEGDRVAVDAWVTVRRSPPRVDGEGQGALRVHVDAGRGDDVQVDVGIRVPGEREDGVGRVQGRVAGRDVVGERRPGVGRQARCDAQVLVALHAGHAVGGHGDDAKRLEPRGDGRVEVDDRAPGELPRELRVGVAERKHPVPRAQIAEADRHGRRVVGRATRELLPRLARVDRGVQRLDRSDDRDCAARRRRSVRGGRAGRGVARGRGQPGEVARDELGAVDEDGLGEDVVLLLAVARGRGRRDREGPRSQPHEGGASRQRRS